MLTRILGPEQWGIAVTFILIQQFLDTTSEGGINKYILQREDGINSKLQSTVQFMSVLRGGILALLLLTIAYPLSSWVNLNHSVFPFVILAMTSISVGLTHFDSYRLQRSDVFLNESVSTLVGELISLVACIVAVCITPTYLAVLVGIFFKSFGVAACSHLLARRKYRASYYANFKQEILRYSWPLLVNGPVMFFSSQADRLVVNSTLGIRELGIYSAAITLLLFPLGVLTRLFVSVFVPKLSKEFHNAKEQEVETEFSGVVLSIYLVSTLGFSAVGYLAMDFLYGNDFKIPALTASLIGFIQGVRFLRTWPASLALSVGKTSSLLFSNLFRLAAIPIGACGILLDRSVNGLVLGLLAAEIVSLVVMKITLNIARSRPVLNGFFNISLALIVFLSVLSFLWVAKPNPFLIIVVCASILVAALLCMRAFNPKLLPRNLKSFGW